jgi:hypothetical protein
MRPIVIITLLVAVLASSMEGRSQSREDFGQPSSKSIHIFPNPTNNLSEYVNVRVAPFSSEKVKLSLHNIIGNEISVETEVVDEHELRMRIKELASGYYFVTVKDEISNFRGTYKLLIK